MYRKELEREIMNYNFIEKQRELNSDIKYNQEILFQKDLYLKKIEKIELLENDELVILENKYFELEEKFLETNNYDLINIIENIKIKINNLTN